jgi:hypothetical protein
MKTVFAFAQMLLLGAALVIVAAAGVAVLTLPLFLL